MRHDMGKIITERPRYGSRTRNLKTRMSIKWKGNDDEYNIPSRASNSAGRQYGWDKREFSDVLGPLKRYIYKQIGRKWDDVYSEMCQVLDKRKVTHSHVFDHVYAWVSTDVYIGRDGLYYERPYGGLVRDLYVDPKTGIIKRQISPKEDKKQRPLTLIVVNDYEEFEKIDGIWYHTKYDKGSTLTPEKYCTVRMKYLKRVLKQKRQLGKKDLKKMGLRYV